MRKLFVLDVTVVQSVDDDCYHAIPRDTEMMKIVKADYDLPEYVEVKTELIKGRKFVNANGEMVVLGVSGDAQKALGLYFESFENVEKGNRELSYSLNAMMVERGEALLRIRRYNELSLWGRLMFWINSKDV